jgi:hypothetical protein
MTFEKVGHAMLQNGGGGGGRGAQGGEAGPPAPNDRRLLDELERKLEERIEAELLPYCTDGANSTKLASRPQQFACVVGAGGPSSGSSDRQLGIKLAEKLGQPGKEAIGDDKAGERVWSYGRLKTPMDLHRPDSPALAALLTGGIFSPVCSWVQDDATGIGGSVGELSKMDPLRENDWVDDFLLEVIMAIGIRDALQYPISFMPVWLSLSTLDEDKIKTFPTKHLPSLSLKPSISTNAMALKLLTSAGVPVTPKLARMSIREAMATLASEPGVWLGGQGDSVKTVLANDGLEHACNCIASLAKARALLPAVIMHTLRNDTSLEIPAIFRLNLPRCILVQSRPCECLPSQACITCPLPPRTFSPECVMWLRRWPRTRTVMMIKVSRRLRDFMGGVVRVVVTDH